VLRLLKIITPVKCVIPLYDGYICCPKEADFPSLLYPKDGYDLDDVGDKLLQNPVALRVRYFGSQWVNLEACLF
jgi:hypothetical protein